MYKIGVRSYNSGVKESNTSFSVKLNSSSSHFPSRYFCFDIKVAIVSLKKLSGPKHIEGRGQVSCFSRELTVAGFWARKCWEQMRACMTKRVQQQSLKTNQNIVCFRTKVDPDVKTLLWQSLLGVFLFVLFLFCLTYLL